MFGAVSESQSTHLVVGEVVGNIALLFGLREELLLLSVQLLQPLFVVELALVHPRQPQVLRHLLYIETQHNENNEGPKSKITTATATKSFSSWRPCCCGSSSSSSTAQQRRPSSFGTRHTSPTYSIVASELPGVFMTLVQAPRGQSSISCFSKCCRIVYTRGLSPSGPIPFPSSTSEVDMQAGRQVGRSTHQGPLLDGRGLLLSVERVLLVGRDLLPLPLSRVDEERHRPSSAVRAVGLVAVIHALVHWLVESFVGEVSTTFHVIFI